MPIPITFSIQFEPRNSREEQAINHLHALIGTDSVSNQSDIKRLFNRLSNEEYGAIMRLWSRRMYRISSSDNALPGKRYTTNFMKI